MSRMDRVDWFGETHVNADFRPLWTIRACGEPTGGDKTQDVFEN